MIYDDIDLKDAYRTGFWIGALSGMFSMLVLCITLGLYLA